MAEQLHHVPVAECWCSPTLFQMCSECGVDAVPIQGGAMVPVNPDCPLCGGSGIVEPYDPNEPTVLVHHILIEKPEKRQCPSTR